MPSAPAAVALARPVYEEHVRRPARVYWLSYESVAADGFPDRVPVGPAAAYAAYLEGGPAPPAAASSGGVSVFALFDARSRPIAATLSRQTAPPGASLAVWNDWEVRYEANTALGFWVRRRADGTAALFRDGLAELLTTFDAEWVAANGG